MEWNNNLRRSGLYIICNIDGACPLSGKLGAKAGIGVYFAKNHPWNVSEPLNSLLLQTTTVAEIHAAIRAVNQACQNGVYFLEIRSDSEFLVKGMTVWIHDWERSGLWVTESGYPVLNKQDFLALKQAVSRMSRVKFILVPRNQNQEADRLAKDAVAEFF